MKSITLHMNSPPLMLMRAMITYLLYSIILEFYIKQIMSLKNQELQPLVFLCPHGLILSFLVVIIILTRKNFSTFGFLASLRTTPWGSSTRRRGEPLASLRTTPWGSSTRRRGEPLASLRTIPWRVLNEADRLDGR